MTSITADTTPRPGRPRRMFGGARSRLSRFWSGITAVSIKELRGRMRGRRAFVVLTIYLLLLAAFSFGIYVYLKQQAATATVSGIVPGDFPGGMPFPGGQTLSNGTALSAAIGHGIFGGLLLLETLLVLVLAPAFTTGAISLEREKQTIDMLVTTPLSTLGMVIGKLFSALTYVFLLILASIPFASLVFVFGGVGPEDLVRAYTFLFALAFGMGALGLFISAVVRRTQTATVLTFILVLVFSIGTAATHQFWLVATRQQSTSSGLLLSQRAGRAPEALLWVNPFAADMDMVCATAPDAYHVSCEYVSGVTGRPYFGTPTTTTQPGTFPGIEKPGVIIDDGMVPVPLPVPDCPPNARCAAPGAGIAEPDFGFGEEVGVGVGVGVDGSTGTGAETNAISFGFPRDTFWPKSAATFAVMGVFFTLLAAQLVSPTRRLHLPRLRRQGRREAQVETAAVAVEATPATDEAVE